MAATRRGLYIAPQLEQLLSMFKALGYTTRYTSGFRSIAKQRSLYNAWIRRGKTGLPVATPGLSTHNYGLGVDVVTNAPDDVKRYVAQAAGLVWFGPSDPVHYDPYGPRAWAAIIRGTPTA